MKELSLILTDLKAAIAAQAARDRTLTTLLVAVWGRIARMGARLERLIAQWRAGTLPVRRTTRAGEARLAYVPGSRPCFPTSPGWLIVRVPYAVGFGSQLQHLLTDAEWAAFLAAVPQARRVLRPLLRMLTVDPVPEVVRKVARPVVVAAEVLPDGVEVEGGSHFLPA